MESNRSLKDRVKDAISQYGPTAVALAQFGFNWWYVIRHGLTGL